ACKAATMSAAFFGAFQPMHLQMTRGGWRSPSKTSHSPLSSPFASKKRRCSMLAGVQECCVPGALRINYGREPECSATSALSLYPEEPRAPFRISSLRPCEPAAVLQKVSILELLRQLAA